jgi:hypothetical protein
LRHKIFFLPALAIDAVRSIRNRLETLGGHFGAAFLATAESALFDAFQGGLDLLEDLPLRFCHRDIVIKTFRVLVSGMRRDMGQIARCANVLCHGLPDSAYLIRQACLQIHQPVFEAINFSSLHGIFLVLEVLQSGMAKRPTAPQCRQAVFANAVPSLSHFP